MSQVVFPSEGERLARPQASSALYAALAANTERFSQPYQYGIPPLQTTGISRRMSSAGYDSPSSGLPSPTWPTPPHTPSKLSVEPKPLLLPPSVVSSASPIRMSPRTHPRRLSNASARFSRRVSIASAFSISRPPSSARLQSRQVSVRLASYRTSSAFDDSLPEEILGEGDVVGHGAMVNGEVVTAIDHGRKPVLGGPQNGALARYEIVRKLGSGSYATVFLAREILSEPAPPTDSDFPFEWTGSDDAHADPDMTIRTPGRKYGNSFAIKCLSRASLTTPESLAVQMLEATIHGSLPVHPNVVSLHAALESPSCLFLVLEFVRGPDLFYFLEQSRDALPPSPLSEEHEFTPRPPSHVPEPSSRTPPTPSLLCALGPSLILSPTRLKLISSMVRQMCDAIAACHAHGVSHRDIKPENFIVTDAHAEADTRCERRVVVKLSDFGLATNEQESADMDCGSAPYMSYECRNNCAPTYNPRAADVWSLGIVLINMLYHVNPWSDTFDGACPSFTAFRADPINFFLNRFAGMTRAVATFLATRVFCIPDTGRIDAVGFGEWVKNLVRHFGGDVTATPVMSAAGDVVLGGVPVERDGLIDVEGVREAYEYGGLGLVLDEDEPLTPKENAEAEKENIEDHMMRTTTSGGRKRGKRGAKKKNVPPTPEVIVTPLGEDSAAKVQDLARELSASKVLAKKPSKWSLFRVRNESGSGSSRKEAAKGLESVKDGGEAASTPTVRSLLGSLDAVNRPSPAPRAAAPVPDRYVHPHAPGATHVPPPTTPAAHAPHTPSPLGGEVRGRRPADRWGGSPIGQFGTGTDARANHSPASGYRAPKHDSGSTSSLNAPRPEPSPAPSVRAHDPYTHSRDSSRASAADSVNWRQSTSTVSTSFTHFSNGSAQTVSTVATSVSGASVAGKKSIPPSVRSAPKRVPPPRQSNVKDMEGVPWELDALPRQAHPRVKGQLVQGDIFGGPAPSRRNRPPPRPQHGLGTITEQPASFYRRTDASSSSAGLGERSASPEVPKKVQKGQINTLKGMLRAFGAGARD